MREIIIGGEAQGKLNVARAEYSNARIIDGSDILSLTQVMNTDTDNLILNHTHLLIRRMLENRTTQEDILKELMSLLSLGKGQADKNIVMISDEIGCGIVPIDPFERQWREATGRILTALAGRADRVERVTCGIVQILK